MQMQHLKPLDDVPVVPRCGHPRVSAGSIASRESPTHGRLLDNVVGFDKQIVHLVVEVHGDGYRSAFGCENQMTDCQEGPHMLDCHHTISKAQKKDLDGNGRIIIFLRKK